MRATAWVFALSFFAQAFAPRETAAASVWGFASGWQREIGFFNLVMVLITRFQRSLALAIVVLTMLVGTNHLATILSGKSSLLHEVFAGVNYAAASLGSMALFTTRD